MSNAATSFEQVSVEFAKKIAEKEKMNAPLRMNACAICGDEVPLEECKVDEYGVPVHDGCYIKKVLM